MTVKFKTTTTVLSHAIRTQAIRTDEDHSSNKYSLSWCLDNGAGGGDHCLTPHSKIANRCSLGLRFGDYVGLSVSCG